MSKTTIHDHQPRPTPTPSPLPFTDLAASRSPAGDSVAATVDGAARSPPTSDPQPILVTQLLEKAAAGSETAAAELLARVYDELRALAGAMFRDQKAGGTLQPTALVHEAYLKLVGQEIEWTSRGQFFVVATKAMRSILIDHARARNRAKRGGGWQRVTLEAAGDTPVPGDGGAPVEAIDAALTELAELDPRKARVVELRFFGGLTGEQAADVLGIARSTAADEWRVARAWLYQRLRSEVQ